MPRHHPHKARHQKKRDFRDRSGFNFGPALKHYRCFYVVDGATKELLFSNTIEFLHEYLTTPIFSEGNHIVHALNFLSCAIKDAPAAIHHKQLTAISNLRNIFTTLGCGAVTLGGGMATLGGGSATLGVGTGRVRG